MDTIDGQSCTGMAGAGCGSSIDFEDMYTVSELYKILRFKIPKEIDVLKRIVRKVVSTPNCTSENLQIIIRDILEENKIDVKRSTGPKHSRVKRIDITQITRSNLLAVYRQMCVGNGAEFKYNHSIKDIFITKEMRSLSGELIVALFTSPIQKTSSGTYEFTCTYDCIMCPRPIIIDPTTGIKKKYPRSYPPNGPATRRADENGFDTLKQLLSRMWAYWIMGHDWDKLKIICLGGTWHSHNSEYLNNFVRDVYWVINNFEEIVDRIIKSAELGLSDEKIVLPPKKSKEEEIEFNRHLTTSIHISGFSIETRPDQISVKSLIQLRKHSVTMPQYGIEHIDDKLLRRINRRCKNRHNALAIMLTYAMCLKCDVHYMPDLPMYLTEEAQKRIDNLISKIPRNDPDYEDLVREVLETVKPEDISTETTVLKLDEEMFDYIINHGWGDEWKIYGTIASDYTPLAKWIEMGVYKPYFEDVDYSKLTPGEWESMSDKEKTKYKQTHNPYHHLMIKVLQQIPKYVRVVRINRDIPTEYIKGGNDAVNGRQYIEEDIIASGGKINEIRFREIKNKPLDPSRAILRLRPYWAYSEEPKFAIFQIFIEFCDPETETIYAFLRLGCQANIIPEFYKKQIDAEAPELTSDGCVFIRELKTYGKVTKVDTKTGNTQHIGFGTKLIQAAEYLAYHFLDARKMAVVAGAGVKEYYTNYGRRYAREFGISGDWHKYGYHDEGHYMTKYFPDSPKISRNLSAMLFPQLHEVCHTLNPFTKETSFPVEYLKKAVIVNSDVKRLNSFSKLFILMLMIIFFVIIFLTIFYL